MTTQPLEGSLARTHGRPWWIMPALVVALAVIGLLAYGLLAESRGRPETGPAPDFALHTFDGETLRLSDYHGQPVVINFWASWCIECDREMPALENSYRRHQGEVMFLGVDYLDTERPAREYLARFGTTYPNGPDLGSRISDAYRIRGVPETFFIGKDGTVRGVHIGPLDEAQLEGWIAQLKDEVVQAE
jgi:cytochrome c biogenesis protein CcmG, thiol:disulfide interchange protein DsbE